MYRVHSQAISAPDNLLKIPFESIYGEYESTLRIAETTGLLPAGTCARVRDRLRERLCKRLAIMQAEASQPKWVGCVRYILPSPQFSPREKSRRMYAYLRAFLRETVRHSLRRIRR